MQNATLMLASSFSSKIHSSIIECLTQRQGKKNEEVEEKVSMYIPVWELMSVVGM